MKNPNKKEIQKYKERYTKELHSIRRKLNFTIEEMAYFMDKDEMTYNLMEDADEDILVMDYQRTLRKAKALYEKIKGEPYEI